MRSSRPLLALASCLVVLVAGAAACSRAPADAIRPSTPTFAEGARATGCAIVDGRNEPFVVDWPADRRADLEAALKHDVAVVAYGCDTLRVLPDCAVEGIYRFTGVTEKEQVLKLDDSDEVRANLPLSGLKLAGRLSADLSRGSTLDIALAITGKKTVLRGLVLTQDLKGECEGATHYVRSATLGAFAMATGTRAQITSAADLFGVSVDAGSSSTAQTESRDGRLDACRAVTAPTDTEVPQCSAPLRLELRPIRAKPPATRVDGHPPDESTTPTCPAGFVPSEAGKCIAASSPAPHICAAGDPADCTVQCEKQSMASCAILGRMYETGHGVAKDPGKAFSLLDRACNGGATPACGRLGEILVHSGKRDEGLALMRKSCQAGFADACVTLVQSAESSAAARHVDLVSVVRANCLGGHAASCASLAWLFHEGLGVRQNDGEFFHYAELACGGEASQGCVLLAQAYREGRGVAADMAKAATILRTACDRGASESCTALSLMYFQGQGVTRSDSEGVAYLTRGCEGDDRPSCLVLGMRYQGAIGVPRDPERAVRYLTRACEAGVPAACTAARRQQLGPRDAGR
jgi:TPR repeat protein